MTKRTQQRRNKGLLPGMIILMILGTVCFISLTTFPQQEGSPLPVESSPLPTVGLAPRMFPTAAPAVIIVVATPTNGPDNMATRAAIEIRAAQDQAAGQAAYRLAGEAELTRQWALATIEGAEAQIEATHVAELNGIKLAATRVALELEAADDRATATRVALIETTVQAKRNAEATHAAAIRIKERDTELHQATVREWTKPLSVAAMPVLLFGFVTVAVLLMIRAALARNLANDIMAVVERVTGHFAPIIDGTVVPISSTDVTGLTALAGADRDMIEMLYVARQVSSLAINQLRTAGYTGGGPKWTRLMQKLADDPRSPGGLGWVFLDGTGGGKRYLLRAGVNINDIIQAYGGFMHQSPPTLMRTDPIGS